MYITVNRHVNYRNNTAKSSYSVLLSYFIETKNRSFVHGNIIFQNNYTYSTYRPEDSFIINLNLRYNIEVVLSDILTSGTLVIVRSHS